MNTQLENDIAFVKSILPESYMVLENPNRGSIWCISNTGIRKLPYLSKDGRLIDDAEDEETWNRFFKSIKLCANRTRTQISALLGYGWSI